MAGFRSPGQRKAFYASQEDKNNPALRFPRPPVPKTPEQLAGNKMTTTRQNTLPELNPMSKAGGWGMLKQKLKTPGF